jgi:hypothetical protein
MFFIATYALRLLDPGAGDGLAGRTERKEN